MLELPIYTMRWSKEALDAFVKVWNDNCVFNEQGQLLSIELDLRENGDALFIIHTEEIG